MSFGGIDIITVAAGTVIEHKGEKLTVTDDHIVHKMGKCYVTKAAFDLLKARFSGEAAQ